MTGSNRSSATAAKSPQRRERFTLAGRSLKLDPRTHAIRPDLADVALAGQLFAPHYAAPTIMACALEHVRVTAAPVDDGGDAVTELLYGETFAALDISGGWAWGYCVHDRYVGYVPASSLGDPFEGEAPLVSALGAPLLAGAASDAAQKGHLPLGARAFGQRVGDFIQTTLGFIPADAVAPRFADVASVAEALLGTPYVWGGRSSDGIDCSGLVQQALGFNGVAAPRDSDQQETALGDELAENAPLRRNDLVFFPGHVGIMADEVNLLHANSHAMAVSLEPLAQVTERVSTSHFNPITSRKRLS